jgi:hypothetical protein
MNRRHTDVNFERAATNWALLVLLAGFWAVAVGAVVASLT